MDFLVWLPRNKTYMKKPISTFNQKLDALKKKYVKYQRIFKIQIFEICFIIDSNIIPYN